MMRYFLGLLARGNDNDVSSCIEDMQDELTSSNLSSFMHVVCLMKELQRMTKEHEWYSISLN